MGNDNGKLQEDADELQARDENNRLWVSAWREAAKKSNARSHHTKNKASAKIS